MEEKKLSLLKCGLHAFGAYSIISFLWVAFIATGISNGNTDISAFAIRLMESNLAIALFSAVYGFSFLIMRAKNLSDAAKRSIHILLNYVAAMVCVYALHANVSDAKASTWIVLIFFASVVFFLIYGAAVLVSFLIKRHKR